MSALDSLAVSLSPGVQLIEANAGTGKTHALTTLYARLIVEEDLEVSQILAVTFTEAATKELRDRVRQCLRKAAVALEKGDASNQLAARWLKGDRARAAAALESAVLGFDQAQIFTIHSFAQRLLRDFAFESGALFESEFLGDSASLRDEITNDFWRLRFCGEEILPSLLILRANLGRQTFSKLLRCRLSHDGLRVLPAETMECAAMEAEIQSRLRELAGESKATLESLFEQLEALAKSEITSRIEAMRRAFKALREDGRIVSTADFDSLLALAADYIREHKDKRKKAPLQLPPICDVIQEVRSLADRWAVRIRHDYLEWALPRLEQRKLKANVLTYDDLLYRLREAVRGPKANELRALAGSRYGAALIDEFQDTDPVQYEALRILFSGPKHRLLFIGDPKQAIYGFRGADVHTYLRARKAAPVTHSLATNWRSEESLINAVNRLFSREAAFGAVPLGFAPSAAPSLPKEGFRALTDNETPMRIRYLDPQTEKPLGLGASRPLVIATVAADVAALLKSGDMLGGRALSAGDIAILLRANAQGELMQRELNGHGVRSVMQTEASVFESEEADHMQAIIMALCTPARSGCLQAALASSLFGLDAEEIAHLNANDGSWQRWFERFVAWREAWEEIGFLAMFRRLLTDEGVHERLAPRTGGTRALTNYLHIAEILQNAATEEQLAPDALAAWYRRRHDSAEDDSEARQLRLESDEDAVRLVTVHKSKGLEFPVVFAPFLWEPVTEKKKNGKANPEGIFYADPADDNAPTLNFQPDSETASTADKHNMAEALRLAYVAVTRAENCCYIYAGNFSGVEQSALGYLVSDHGGMSFVENVANLAECSASCIGLEKIEGLDVEGIRLDPKEDADRTGITARSFHGSISQSALVTSFSSLKGHREEMPDRDAPAGDSPFGTPVYDASIHGMERSIRAGYFFHEVLETLDFRAPEKMGEIVDATLDKYGLAPSPARESILQVLGNLLNLQFPSAGTLSSISFRNRLSEVEFWMPASGLTPVRLAKAFRTHRGQALPENFPERIGRTWFRPVEGFMQGVIDSVVRFGDRYFVIDWKSNWLGPDLEHYTPERIEQEMEAHMYHLQYHLYTVATHRFLRERLPGYSYETHFGGVFYVFLRGVTPQDPASSLYFDRPSLELVESIEGALA